MTNRKEAMSYLLQLELEEPKWTQLPENDIKIKKLRLLFNSESKNKPGPKRGKRRKWTKVKMVHKGNERVFNSLDELCNQMNFNKNSVKSSLDSERNIKDCSFERVYEDEESGE